MTPRPPPSSNPTAEGKILHLRPPAPPTSRPAARKKAVRARTLAEIGHAEVERAFGLMASRITEGAGVAEAQRIQLTLINGLVLAKACFISRFSSERNLLLISTVRGRNDPRIAAAAPGEGPVGRAYQDRCLVREDELLCAPLLSGDAVFGCLTLVAPKRSVSDTLLASLASSVSACIEVARLREEATLRTKDLETAVAGLNLLERSREELLANVSHDLKNPLTTIKAYLAMLEKQALGPVTPKQEQAIGVCGRSADRLLRLINDLLLISRLESGKMELHDKPFGLKALADEVLQAHAVSADQCQVKLSLRSSSEAFVRGDRERVFEAISSLVENGLQRSSAGSKVEVGITRGGHGHAVLSVRDQGEGISEPDRVNLFDMYHRPRGGGLGLPIVAKIVHLHGGRVEADSQVDEGTTFRFYLPLFAGAVSSTGTSAEPRTGGVLLVEDDADCREVLQQVLEMEGHRVISAPSATAAKALLEHIRPGLVLLDLRLSEEDGMSVLHYIRQTRSLEDVAVYLISGSRDLASLSAGKGIDRIDGFFEKPLNVAKVLDTVASVVRPGRKGQP